MTNGIQNRSTASSHLANRTGGTTTKTVSVDGESNHVRPTTLEAALDGDSSAVNELRNNAGFEITLRGDTAVQLNARGRVEDGAWDNDKVDAGDRIDYTNSETHSTGNSYRHTTTKESRTALQFTVESPDGKMQALDYDRNMRLTPGEDGNLHYGDQTFAAGSKLRGHFLEDGRAGNNDGQFKVRVSETKVETAETQAQETVRRSNQTTSDRVDRDAINTSCAATTVERATIPPPSRADASSELAVDRENGVVATNGGYTFDIGQDSVRVRDPNGNHTDFDFQNNRWIESDGTVANLNRSASDANYVNSKDLSGFDFVKNDDGRITGMNIYNGDSRVRVDGFGSDNGPSISRLKSDGDEHRALRNDQNGRLTMYNGGFGRAALGTDLETGWYATQKTEQGTVNHGWTQGLQNGRNLHDHRIAYQVDDSLKPKFGSAEYGTAFQNFANSQLGEIAGQYEAVGYDRATAFARAADSQAFAGVKQYAGTQQLANDRYRAGDYDGLFALNQGYGGMPHYFQNANQSMGSIQQLYQVMAMMQMLQGSFQIPLSGF